MRLLVRRAAGYRLACAIAWFQRFVYSEISPTDPDSRAAVRGELRSGEVQRGDRRVLSQISRAAVSACLPPLPSQPPAPAPPGLLDDPDPEPEPDFELVPELELVH